MNTPTEPGSRSAAASVAMFLALLVLAGVALSQGAGGGFIFDDVWNLNGLGGIAADPSLRGMAGYIFSGISSELGRPLALATFAMQYDDWPWRPGEFVQVNILLHLLNACLVFYGGRRLARMLNLPGPAAQVLPLAVAGIWLLSPLQATAVLYVVQRMAVLSGTFMLLGIVLYLHGRQRVLDGSLWRGRTWMGIGVVAGTGLGVLAKENAALLPAAILVLEYTLLSAVDRGSRWRSWCAVFLLLPTAVLVAYLAWRLPGLVDGNGGRDFTPAQRLLTEGRVLFLYLGELFLPAAEGIRLYYDDLPVSRGWWHPWTTLPAALAWVGLVVLAVRYRRAAPVAAFAILWFLVNHLLESSFLPLEIAFGHRNYIASLGPVCWLVWTAHRLLERVTVRRWRMLLGILARLYFVFLALALWQAAALWGDPVERDRAWGRTQPDSARAQMRWASSYELELDFGSVARVLGDAQARWPGDPQFVLAQLALSCYADFPPPLPAVLGRSLDSFDGQVSATINALERVLVNIQVGICPRFGEAELAPYFDRLIQAPAFAGKKPALLLMRSRLAALTGNPVGARDYLDAAIRLKPTVFTLREGVLRAVEAGDIARAQDYLQRASAIPEWHPVRRWLNEKSFGELEALVADRQSRTRNNDAPDGP